MSRALTQLAADIREALKSLNRPRRKGDRV